MKTRGRTLSVHTCRVHFHKIEPRLAMGLPFLSCQDYFTTSIMLQNIIQIMKKLFKVVFNLILTKKIKIPIN